MKQICHQYKRWVGNSLQMVFFYFVWRVPLILVLEFIYHQCSCSLSAPAVKSKCVLWVAVLPHGSHKCKDTGTPARVCQRTMVWMSHSDWEMPSAFLYELFNRAEGVYIHLIHVGAFVWSILLLQSLRFIHHTATSTYPAALLGLLSSTVTQLT